MYESVAMGCIRLGFVQLTLYEQLGSTTYSTKGHFDFYTTSCYDFVHKNPNRCKRRILCSRGCPSIFRGTIPTCLITFHEILIQTISIKKVKTLWNAKLHILVIGKLHFKKNLFKKMKLESDHFDSVILSIGTAGTLFPTNNGSNSHGNNQGNQEANQSNPDLFIGFVISGFNSYL